MALGLHSKYAEWMLAAEYIRAPRASKARPGGHFKRPMRVDLAEVASGERYGRLLADRSAESNGFDP
jgi:hypothetical protein